MAPGHFDAAAVMFWKGARLKCSERGFASTRSGDSIWLVPRANGSIFGRAAADVLRASDVNGQHCCNTDRGALRTNGAGTGLRCISAI